MERGGSEGYGTVRDMLPTGSHAIEMVFIVTGHAGSSPRSFIISLKFIDSLGLRSGSFSGH